MKKLWIVSVETEVAVVAEDRYKAEEIARIRAEDEIRENASSSIFAMEVKEERNLGAWMDAIPYAGAFSDEDHFDPQNPDKTCLEILNDIKGREKADEQPKFDGLG